LTIEELSLNDLESVRLMLSGRSVIDWHKLAFDSHESVARFLRVNEFNPDSADEMGRLEDLRDDAVDYLTTQFSVSIPDGVAADVPAADLFLIASRRGRHRKWACVVLKVMHIIQHLAGREAMVQLPISDDTVFRAIELKVMQVVDELRGAGYPIQEFEWSRKPRHSQITKLLAKRSSQAAKLYDKLRFRLIVRHHDDLMPILAVLTRQLIPFNYVVPGESVNHLLSFDDELHAHKSLTNLRVDLQDEDEVTEIIAQPQPLNEFTAPEYQIINFVADLPVRIDTLLPDWPIPVDTSHVVFVQTEFQLCDRATATRNEDGASSHDAYKARQRDKVRTRLVTEPPE
jgi:uncharacterized protein (TIGR04552 family)